MPSFYILHFGVKKDLKLLILLTGHVDSTLQGLINNRPGSNQL